MDYAKRQLDDLVKRSMRTSRPSPGDASSKGDSKDVPIKSDSAVYTSNSRRMEAFKNSSQLTSFGSEALEACKNAIAKIYSDDMSEFAFLEEAIFDIGAAVHNSDVDAAEFALNKIVTHVREPSFLDKFLNALFSKYPSFKLAYQILKKTYSREEIKDDVKIA